MTGNNKMKSRRKEGFHVVIVLDMFAGRSDSTEYVTGRGSNINSPNTRGMYMAKTEESRWLCPGGRSHVSEEMLGDINDRHQDFA